MLSIELDNALMKADRLIWAGQFDSAIIFYNRLRDFVKDSLEKLLIEIEIAWCLETKGNYEESQEEFLRILESTILLNESKYSHKEVQKAIISTYHGLAWVDTRLENIESAFIWAQKALVESIVLKDEYLISTSNFYLAHVHYYIGQSDKIFELLDKSIDFVRKSADQKLLGKVLILYGLSYQMTSDLEKSLNFLNEALTIYEDMGDLKNISICLNNISIVYRLKGEYQISLRLLKKVEVIAEDQANWLLNYHVVDNITEILLLTGEMNKARESAQKLVQLARNNHFQTLIGKALGILAQIEQHTNLQVARDLFEEAIILLQTSELEAYLIECVNRYLKFLIKVEDYDIALELLDKYEKIIEDKQLNVYKSDFFINRGLIESNQNLNLGLAKNYYQKSLANATTSQLFSLKIKSYIYLAENTLESYQIRPHAELMQIAKTYVTEGFDLALTKNLYPDIASINLIRALIAQLTDEMATALKIIDETLALTRNKGLKLQEAQANALKNKLLELKKNNNLQDKSAATSRQLLSEFDSTRAVISTIRIFYHEDFSHIMPSENQLAVVYYCLTEMGPVSKIEDLSDIGISEYNLNKPSIDEILLLMGSSYSIAVGQGNNYQEGLFGPLPVPRLLTTYSLVYSKDLSSQDSVSAKKSKEMIPKEFGFLCLLYPKEFDTLFFDRELLTQEFSFFLEKIIQKPNEINLSKWKTELLKSVQAHYRSLK